MFPDCVTDGNLSFHANGSAGDQRRPLCYAGLVDGKAGGEVVAAVQYQVGKPDLFIQRIVLQCGGNWCDIDFGVHLFQGLFSGAGLVQTNVIVVM